MVERFIRNEDVGGSIPPSSTMLIRIVSPYFVAGVVLGSKRVIRAAPILKYMKGWTKDQVLSYAKKKGWKASPVYP